MSSRLFLIPALYVIMSCASKDQGDAGASDSTAAGSALNDSVASVGISPASTEAGITSAATVNPNLKDADTLFNILARQKLVRGEFGSIKVVTRKFLDASNLRKPGNLLAVLVHSGEGDKSDKGEFQTLYSVLGIFEVLDDKVALVTSAEIWASENYGLRASTTEGEPLKLKVDLHAAMIHFKSSEEGAGDSGFRTDNVGIFVLLKGQITNVLEVTLEDFHFASNETDSYEEHTATSTLSVLHEMTNGLPDIAVTTNGFYTSTSEEEPGATPTEQNKPEETKGPTDGTFIFKWNGLIYEKVVGH